MTQLISISLTDEASEIVNKLKAKKMNISEAFCIALVAYWKKRIKKEASE